MQRSALCRSRRELSNAYFVAKFGLDTAENEPCQVCPTEQCSGEMRCESGRAERSGKRWPSPPSAGGRGPAARRRPGRTPRRPRRSPRYQMRTSAAACLPRVIAKNNTMVYVSVAQKLRRSGVRRLYRLIDCRSSIRNDLFLPADPNALNRRKLQAMIE